MDTSMILAYGRILNKGMQVRERVDYGVYYRVSREKAEESLKEAENFIQRIEKALVSIMERE